MPASSKLTLAGNFFVIKSRYAYALLYSVIFPGGRMSVAKPTTVSREAAESLSESMVYIVDDEDAVRRGLSGLLQSVGLSVETFASSQDFMASPKQNAPSCLILDVRLRGENGLDFQDSMSRHGLR